MENNDALDQLIAILADRDRQLEDYLTTVGVQGPTGEQGAPGADGPAGADGDDGAIGPQGPQGDPGDDGDDGAPGPQGIPGNDGATGATGPGLPTGGAIGTAPVKQSGTDYDTAWIDVATQDELDAHAALPGHTHPNLATHDSLGLATDAELATHAATPHSGPFDEGAIWMGLG